MEGFRLPSAIVRSQGLPTNRLGRVFRDRDELPTSSDLGAMVTEALRASEYLIVLCSPSAARSTWVNEEVRRFITESGADRVLCAVLSGDPASSLPLVLRSRDAEPLAADFREGGDGKALGKLKIVAGLLNVGLDEIRRRDLQRRYRRLVVASISLALSLGLATILATLAVRARNEAQNERDRAQFEVETLRGTGDLLVDLFEYDVDSLTARGLVDRALAATRGSEYPAATRARMMHTIARIYIKLKEYDLGLDVFEASLRIKGSELPEDHESVAVGLRDLGRFYGEQLQIEPAVRLLIRSQRMYERLGVEDYEADCLDRLGDLYLDWKRIDEAEAAIVEALAIREAIDDGYAINSLNSLGALRREQRRLPESEEGYRRALTLAERRGSTFWIGATKINLAQTFAVDGRYEAAIDLALEGRVILGPMWAQSDPQDAVVEYVLGLATQGLKKHDEAQQHYRRCIEKVLVPGVAPRTRAVAILAYRGLATLAADDAGALRVLQEAVERLDKSMPDDFPDYIDLQTALHEKERALVQ